MVGYFEAAGTLAGVLADFYSNTIRILIKNCPKQEIESAALACNYTLLHMIAVQNEPFLNKNEQLEIQCVCNLEVFILALRIIKRLSKKTERCCGGTVGALGLLARPAVQPIIPRHEALGAQRAHGEIACARERARHMIDGAVAL
jgi:hypothetical protein